VNCATGRSSHWKILITRGNPVPVPQASRVSISGLTPGPSSPATSRQVRVRLVLPAVVQVDRLRDAPALQRRAERRRHPDHVVVMSPPGSHHGAGMVVEESEQVGLPPAMTVDQGLPMAHAGGVALTRTFAAGKAW
jgi:hypothetical protein